MKYESLLNLKCWKKQHWTCMHVTHWWETGKHNHNSWVWNPNRSYLHQIKTLFIVAEQDRTGSCSSTWYDQFWWSEADAWVNHDQSVCGLSLTQWPGFKHCGNSWITGNDSLLSTWQVYKRHTPVLMNLQYTQYYITWEVSY